MSLSIWQKVQLLLVRIIIAPFWFLDWLASYTYKKPLSKAVAYGLVLTATAGLFYFSLNPSLKGLATNVFSPSTDTTVSETHNNNNEVLGSSEEQAKTPVLVNKRAFPYISARAHLIIDNKTDTILSDHNIHQTFAPASTTKLMTALVSIDLYGENEVVPMSFECTEVESTKIWLPAGARYAVKDLLYGLLVSSAGDVSCALATAKVDYPVFVELMNKKAAEIGMADTQFTNEVGLDGADGVHYSSVWDLYLLSKEAMKNPLLRKIVKTKNYIISDVTGQFSTNISNTNKLLWEIPETAGVKTGTTSGAGEVLIYRYEDGDKGFTIIVMLSEDRFLDTTNMVNWTLASYEWQ